MELQLIVREKRNGLDVYESKRIYMKDLEKKYTNVGQALEHFVMEMKNKVEEELSKPRTPLSIPETK